MFFSEADIDECAEGIIECHNHSRCVNLPGWYHCECRSGFHDNGSYSPSGESCVGKQWSVEPFYSFLVHGVPKWLSGSWAVAVSQPEWGAPRVSVFLSVSTPNHAGCWTWHPMVLRDSHRREIQSVTYCTAQLSEQGAGEHNWPQKGKRWFSNSRFQQSDRRTYLWYVCAALVCLFSIFQHLHNLMVRVMQITSNSLCTLFEE